MRKNHYKYAKNAHNFGFKEGSPKRIFLIINRCDYCNEYSNSDDDDDDDDVILKTSDTNKFNKEGDYVDDVEDEE